MQVGLDATLQQLQHLRCRPSWPAFPTACSLLSRRPWAVGGRLYNDTNDGRETNLMTLTVIIFIFRVMSSYSTRVPFAVWHQLSRVQMSRKCSLLSTPKSAFSFLFCVCMCCGGVTRLTYITAKCAIPYCVNSH